MFDWMDQAMRFENMVWLVMWLIIFFWGATMIIRGKIDLGIFVGGGGRGFSKTYESPVWKKAISRAENPQIYWPIFGLWVIAFAVLAYVTELHFHLLGTQ